MAQSKQETFDKIMVAAADVFVESGYGGARMDEIAKRAGVNKATIYYNVGNKETLSESGGGHVTKANPVGGVACEDKVAVSDPPGKEKVKSN